MKIIFQIDGGRGKCIAATAVCKAIKSQYPNDELIVVSGYPEVFLCNNNVVENLRFNELQYFWQRHIDGKEPRMMLHNPYLETNFILGKMHLIQAWCEMLFAFVGVIFSPTKHQGTEADISRTKTEKGTKCLFQK